MIYYHLKEKLLLVIKILLIYFFVSVKIFATENNTIKDITEGILDAKIEFFAKPKIVWKINDISNYVWKYANIVKLIFFLVLKIS